MSERSTDAVRVALRALTHGVYVISVPLGAHDEFIIVSLLMQFSVQPPRVCFAISTEARIMAALRGSLRGIIGILNAGDVAAVKRYGAPGGVKHLPLAPPRASNGAAVPPEARYWIEFRLVQEIAGGDHVLFLADIVNAGERAAESDATASENSAFKPMILAETGFPYAG